MEEIIDEHVIVLKHIKVNSGCLYKYSYSHGPPWFLQEFKNKVGIRFYGVDRTDILEKREFIIVTKTIEDTKVTEINAEITAEGLWFLYLWEKDIHND